MREILFKAKRIDNGEWVEGWYQPPIVGIHCDGRKESLGASLSIIGNYGFLEDVYIISETVGQFTGLTDKNGKKLFEGDIGKYKQTDGAKRNGQPISCTGKVIYNTKTASYAVESKDEAGCKYFDYFPIKDFEVIGNIHDNPELLEVADNA